MICAACYGMLRGQDKRQWRGTFDLHFDHHTHRWELERSAEIGCCICRSIQYELRKFDHTGGPSPDEYRDPTRQGSFISAFLSEVHEKQGLYRLDFKLHDSRSLGTFLLQQTRNESETRLYTPISKNTSSNEVLQLARYWIRRCTSRDHESCPNEDSDNKGRFYPTRLIDLRPNGLSSDQLRLIVTRVQAQEDQFRITKPKGFYVTLSHCWGDAEIIRLLKESLSSFQENIPTNELPRTFRDAIGLARGLGGKIRYIWIDSLCIVQDDHEDWLSESAQMYEIYRNSYCNISATAAANSDKGLFFPRNPNHLWGDEINLNTEGIPKARSKGEREQHLGLEPLIRRCTILDCSFWDREVDKAPVNMRGWVLQERLMAPRVLHFCQHQIAWECRHLNAAEHFPHGIPSMELKADDIKERSTLKYLIPDRYGRRPVGAIPAEASDAAHENWKRVIERYSKTRLTKEEDKLIALAGIAEMMDSQIRGRYVAGMWERYLASQLLWRVDPVYENGLFSYPSRRPKCYRAPSFSWASVDGPQGIRCGETVREEELQILVEKVNVNTKGDNRFGLVKEGSYLELACVLRKINLELQEKPAGTRYAWYLKGGKRAGGREATAKKHDNVYLDSPYHDFKSIQAFGGQLYCAPARKDPANYLICLLLQFLRSEDRKRCFRRVGLTIIPPYEGGQEDLVSCGGGGSREEGERETICIV
ncbi:MAG: hypothetical protein M1840_004155 [Geoglossum simile]|nr:MAG: hypothetical protein M1840_004155 [Geoglossum simile]